MELPRDEQNPASLFSLTEDLIHSDPSVKYYIINNLDRFMITVGSEIRQKQLLDQITSIEFTNDILAYSELVHEYVKKIILMSYNNEDKLPFLKALENILNDSFQQFIIEDIEGGILTILAELGEELPTHCDRILDEFYKSKVVAKQCLIPAIISQYYSILSKESQNTYIEVFHNLSQQGVPLLKRKISQNLHE